MARRDGERSQMRKLNQTKRVAQLSLVLISLILNQLPAGGQTRQAGVPSGKPQPPAKPTSVESRADGKPIALLSSAKSEEMAAPFNSGKLPKPLRKPSGSIDEMAATLAKQVRARDEQSVSALLTAILTAGFGLRDQDGSVLQTVQPGQGLVFDAWEIAAMAKMYGEGRSVQLVYLSDGLKSIPELKSVLLDSILLNGIRKHAQGEQPLLRFWARFIVELGRQQEEPYDILGAADPKSVRLDAVQSALILRRLIGDFYALGQGNKQTSRVRGEGKTQVADNVMLKGRWLSTRFNRVAILEGSFAPLSKALAVASTEAAQAEKPCAGLGSDPVQDLLATELTSAWGSFFGDTRVGKAVGVANVILTYAQFIATYAALETEITVENPPLVRTPNASPGERRQLTAKVTMNVGKWDQINCFRSALNFFTGLDFSLIDDGPLEGVEVNWNLDEGGARDFYSNSTGVTGKRQIVSFVGDNNPRIQSAGTYAGSPGKGGTAVGNQTRTKTDKEGKAQIYLEGSPKIPYVVKPMMPVMKQAVVRTTIKMKGGDVKGDAADLWGQLRGLLPGLITMPLELLYRTDWASSGNLIVPVRDHESCEGGWNGTIIMVEESWQQPKGFIKASGHTYEETIEVKGSKGIASGQWKSLFHEEGRAPAANSCTMFRRVTTNGTGEREAKFSVLMPEGDQYRIFVSAPSFAATQNYESSQCGGYSEQQRSETKTAGGFSLANLEGKLDPNNPNELSGSKTMPSPMGSRVITWNLRRCK